MIAAPPSHAESGRARVLLYSQRNIYRPEVWRCAFEEFERIVQECDAVDILAPKPGRCFQLRRNNAQRAGKFLPIALNPGIPEIKLDREYDLFLAVCEKPTELLNVNVLKGWQDKCRTSVCWLPEIWIKELPYLKSMLKVLSGFDHILLNVARTVGPLSEAIEKQCLYLPAGVDAILFCPHPNAPKRSIDILSIGRRSETTHQVLLQMAMENGMFYVYDTLRDLHAFDIPQHRLLMANMAKRSRYFIVNPSKIDEPNETAAQVEFGYRYFEGAAAGTIMVGDRPDSDEFREFFNWPDAVVYLPFGSDQIHKTIQELDVQRERQNSIRKNNIVHSLLRHDWAYRWERILQTAGLGAMPALLKRKQRLRDISEIISKDGYVSD
jgi:hypothetical protein